MLQRIQLTSQYNDFKMKTVVHLFGSFGYADKRATVVHVNAFGFDQAWSSLSKKAHSILNHSPTSIKIDIVIEQRPIEILSFIDLISKTKKNYFRYGISFDKNFQQSFLEQELNGNAIIQISPENKRGYLNEDNIQKYIKLHRPDMKPINFSNIRKLYLFSTIGYYYNGEEFHTLRNDSLNNGRRNTPLTHDELSDLIQSGQKYLVNLSKANGKFTYGYFACFDKEINYYNMLRHASTLYAMLEVYEFNPTPPAKSAIEKGLAYLMNSAIYVDHKRDCAFVIDGTSDNQEIKLGANAAAILAFTKYTEVFEESKYLEVCEQLANGILSLQHEDGSFNHVLHYPSLELKERFRIIYYDGEAAFALMRLYKLQKDVRWLKAVEKAFDYFIKKDYWKNHDHWLSYCTNELTLYRPLKKYFKFGLDNAKGKLSFIYDRRTTYPTFLELTLATYKMVQRIKQSKYASLLDDFDENYLIDTIHKRAEYQRNGFFYPEVAMYYKNPQRIIGSFFIRHHSFRTRIDDVEHYLSGYVAYCHELENGRLTP
jgi:hypothetical protein